MNARGEEIIAGDFTALPAGEPADTSPEEDEEVLEDAVVAEADAREGLRGTSWRDFFAARGIPVPPAGG